MHIKDFENAIAIAKDKHGKQDFKGAAAQYRSVLKVFPDHPEALFGMGRIAHTGKVWAKALDYVSRAVKLSPEERRYQFELAEIHCGMGKPDLAEPILRQMLASAPDDAAKAASAARLAVQLIRAARGREARALLDEYLALFPKDDELIFLGARVDALLGFNAKAIRTYESLLSRRVLERRVAISLSLACESLGSWSTYISLVEPLLSSIDDPDVYASMDRAYISVGRLEEAMRMRLLAITKSPRDPHMLSYLINECTASDVITEKEIFSNALLWEKRFGTPDKGKPYGSYRLRNFEGRKLRLGLITRTFHRHVTSTILIPLIPELAKRFELYCFHDGTKTDVYTERLKQGLAKYVNISKLDEAEAAKTIYNCGIDVLIDISGHFDAGRLRILTYRPAPIQIHYAGSACSLGTKSVQYRFSDPVVEPPERGDPFSSEKVLRLPHGFHLYKPLGDTPEPGVCPFEKNGYITFGSFAALHKITPTTLRMWKAAMDAVPGSHFLLGRDCFRTDPRSLEFTKKRFADAGFDLSRMEFLGDTRGHFAELIHYPRIDISLDSFPYAGVTTACDSLWMGVPMVTMREGRFISRICSSILSRVGLSDLVAENQADFALIAAKLAADRDRLRALRASLRATMQASPL
ncbi:MAG TPA: tetratricopeptide repeat protein, partial [Opitutales bacterium]|nr:tetratricopeptide repeat protein [Opitutales bacterium]